MATISTHNGSSVAREHNIRNEKVVSKEPHINPDGLHEIWIDEPIRHAYDRLFGKALKEYNAKQSRADRKIDSYYHAVQSDKKKHTVYEMIIGIYGKNGEEPVDIEQGKAIMQDFVNSWAERNPNLALIGAYYHADEEGEPHVHLDYIPVAHGYKRGLSVQNGLVKALGEQGYEKQGKETAQIQWERNENAALEKICNSYGINIEHPQIEGRQHIDTNTFKAQKAADKAQERLDKLTATLSDKELKAIDVTPKRLTGGFKGLSPEQAQQLLNTSNKLKKENKTLKAEVNKLKSENDAVRKEKDMTAAELKRMQEHRFTKNLDELHKKMELKDQLKKEQDKVEMLCSAYDIPKSDIKRTLEERGLISLRSRGNQKER